MITELHRVRHSDRIHTLETKMLKFITSYYQNWSVEQSTTGPQSILLRHASDIFVATIRSTYASLQWHTLFLYKLCRCVMYARPGICQWIIPLLKRSAFKSLPKIITLILLLTLLTKQHWNWNVQQITWSVHNGDAPDVFFPSWWTMNSKLSGIVVFDQSVREKPCDKVMLQTSLRRNMFVSL